jgi:hypothetical protein
MILERQLLDCVYIGRSCGSVTLRSARTGSQPKEYKQPIQLHSNSLAIPHPPWSLPGTMMWNCCFHGQRMAGSSSANFLFRKYLTRTFIRLVIRERPQVLFLCAYCPEDSGEAATGTVQSCTERNLVRSHVLAVNDNLRQVATLIEVGSL